jgi:hypothetical protein
MAKFAGDFNKPELGSTPGTQPATSISPAYPPNQGFSSPTHKPAVGAALAWSQDQLGGPLVEQESTAASGINPTIVVNGNGDRVGLIIINTGANDCFIGISSAVLITNGIRLSANGGNIVMNLRDDFTLPTRQWWTQNALGGSTLYILEILRYSLTPPVSGA